MLIFKSSVEFFGNIFSEKGIAPDPKKINLIKEAGRPTDKHQVRSLLGVVNYIQRYIPNMVSVVRPLRILTKKNVNFEWSNECEESSSDLKKFSPVTQLWLIFTTSWKQNSLQMDHQPV